MSVKSSTPPIFRTALVIALLILAAFYLIADYDPLGLFTDPSTTPPAGMIGDGTDWWEVYFTVPERIEDPEHLVDTIPARLIDRINGARQTIHIAAFEFDLPSVADALIDAHGRGVEVRWITDDEYGIEADEEAEIALFARLEGVGIPVRDDGRSALMHNKFWIFDRSTVWTGSANVTANGSFRNNNNVIVLHSARAAEIFEQEFAEMWEGQFGPQSPSTVDRQRFTINATPVQILFAPEDEVASHLIPLVEGASRSVRFMAFSFTHDGLGATVLSRADAGVDVQGIFETRGSETEYSELPTLYCAGVSVRQDGNPGTFHHKVWVIDGETVVTGSFNFTQSADDSNDENVVILTNREIAARYLSEFERRWSEARVPSRTEMNCR